MREKIYNIIEPGSYTNKYANIYDIVMIIVILCSFIPLLFGAGAIAFGLLLHKPMRGIIEKVEESKRESDVML